MRNNSNEEEFGLLDIIDVAAANWIFIAVVGIFSFSGAYFLIPAPGEYYRGDMVISANPEQALTIEQMVDAAASASGRFQFASVTNIWGDGPSTRVTFTGSAADDVRLALEQYAEMTKTWVDEQHRLSKAFVTSIIETRLVEISAALSNIESSIGSSGDQMDAAVAPLLSLEQQLRRDKVELELMQADMRSEAEAISRSAVISRPGSVDTIEAQDNSSYAILAAASSMFIVLLALILKGGLEKLSQKPDQKAKLDRILKSLLMRR